MDSFDVFAGSNIAGFDYLEFIPSSSVTHIPDQEDGVISQAISNTLGALFSLKATKSTIVFNESPGNDAAGNFFSQEISAFLAKVTPEILAKLKSMENYAFIVVVKDNNNLKRLVGTIESPLLFRYKTDQKTTPQERNGVLVEFFGKSTDSAPFYLV